MQRVYGFPFLSYMSMGLRLAALGDAGAPLLQSCIIELLHTHKDNARNSNICNNKSNNNNTHLLYRLNYPFFIKIFFFCDFTSYFILYFNFRFKPLDFRKGLTSSAVPQEHFSNNYEVI